MGNLKKCLICGEKYNYCPNCAKTHAWQFYADKMTHYQIFMVLDGYANSFYTQKEAVTMLSNIGITKETDISDLKENIVKQIKTILDYTEVETSDKDNKTDSKKVK